jgi:hypothetical protein
MLIDQRNAGASITPANGSYTVDRWIYYGNQASKFTAQQNAGSITPPINYTKYLGLTSSSAYTVLTGDYFCIGQHIEGFNIADLGYGTASAATTTLSFQVRSSLTGTFGGTISNGGSRSYPFTYTISSANTWTFISITIPGDTSGTWGSSNSYGITVYFGLGVGTTYSGTAGAWSGNSYFSATGAVSVVGTSGATFYITGVQLEPGSIATPYERQIYSDQLNQCQRYYQITKGNYFNGSGTAAMSVPLPFFQTMRAAPTATVSGGTQSSVSNEYVESLSSNGARFTVILSAGGYSIDRAVALTAEL